MIDVDLPYLDAMFPRIAHKLGGGIKTHRLRIEDRRAEHIRIMMFEPCGNIGQQREARGVTFGKAIIGKALDLLEAALGEIGLVSVG